MSYRYHPNPEQWRTELMMQFDNRECMVSLRIKFPNQYADMSHEDGRLFVYKGKLHISFTLAVFPGVPNTMVPCVTGYGEVVLSEAGLDVKEVKIPKFGNNDWSGQAKNFVFFEHAGKLHVIYQCSPEHVVLRLAEDGVNVDEVYRTKSPSWEHGEIRGGTQPFTLAGKWLRFFHSLYRNGDDRADWTYSMGGLIMRPEPPFTIERISQRPILCGDERFVPGWKFHKRSVLIPYGAVQNGDGWDVSCGLNDSFCSMVHLKERDLLL